jgi:hypothetical protein
MAGRTDPGRKKTNMERKPAPIRHADIRVKHCAYGHSVATLMNPSCVTTVPTRTV